MRLLLIFSFCLLSNGQHQEDDWIDPSDMLNYDAATVQMRNQAQNHAKEAAVKEHSSEQSQSSCLADNREYKIIVETLKRKIEQYKNTEHLKLSEQNSNPVFKRFLHKIVNEAEHLGLPDDSQSEVHYDAEVILTKEMLAEIHRFLNDVDWNVGALDEALGKTLVHFKHHNVEEWEWKFEDSFGVDVYTAFMVLLCLLCMVSIIATEIWTHVGWFTQIKRLVILSFVVSIGWNWMYLYKVAFAERQAELSKIGTFDSTCGEKISWSDSLFEWWKRSSSFQNDPCEEYFKSLMINPIFMVSPTKAIAFTFTDFVTEPLKHIGKGIGEFMRSMLAEIPLFYQMPVLVVIGLALLVTCYGASTSVGHMNLFRNNRYREERLPLGEPRRPAGYGVFIRGDGQQPYYVQYPNQPDYVEPHRNPTNLRPEVLRAMEITDGRNPQFVDTDSTVENGKEQGDGHFSQQQKMKDLPQEKPDVHQQREDGPLKERSSVQQQKVQPLEKQRKEESAEESVLQTQHSLGEATEERLCEQLQKKVEFQEERTFGLQGNKEGHVPEPCNNTSIPLDFVGKDTPGSQAELGFKQTPSVETVRNLESSHHPADPEEKEYLEKIQSPTASLNHTI